MANLKGPLFSLNAHNTLGKVITFVKRRGRNIAEKKPEIIDVKSRAQLEWRHMYQKCAALWHALSAAEKREWEGLGSARHMTGFAYWQSQCLRPNPGIYLPLQGGTMSGDIDMAKNRILKLPLPADSQEPLTLAYYTATIEPQLMNEGAHVFHNVAQACADGAWTTLAFNSERFDTDVIHDNVVSNSRLTCRTAGKYLISFQGYVINAVGGHRYANIVLNGVTFIANHIIALDVDDVASWVLFTTYDLIVGDYVEVRIHQNSGAPLNMLVVFNYSPEFMMQRIGT